MYNKIFTKILDSSIWLEPDATRIVWITMIAAMDESGFCQFASVANVARRANVSGRAAQEAIKTLESPDPDSSDPDHEGRRIERIPGGWLVLNAEKYRLIVNRAVSQEKTRQRVAKHRANKRLTVKCNADVTTSNTDVRQSEAYIEAEADNSPISPQMVAQGVLQELCLAGRELSIVLDKICIAQIASGADPTELRDTMIASYGKFLAAVREGALEYVWGAEKFFGGGYWADSKLWPWRKNGAHHSKNKYEIFAEGNS